MEVVVVQDAAAPSRRRDADARIFFQALTSDARLPCFLLSTAMPHGSLLRPKLYPIPRAGKVGRLYTEPDGALPRIEMFTRD